MRRGAALLALVLILPAAGGAALTLDLPATAESAAEEVEAQGSYDLPVGPWQEGHLPVERAEGRLTRQAWRIPIPGTTALALMAPLRQALTEQGFEIALDCETRDCGGFDFRFATFVMAAPAMHVDLGDFRFLSARRGAERVGVLTSSARRAGFVQIIHVAPEGQSFEATAGGAAPTVVTTAEPASPLPVAAAPGSLAERLERDGRAILADLSFPTGSAQLAEGQFASLAELAAYLAERPDRRVALVGHTDSEGSLEANIALSRRRAGSVLERLVSAHGVPRQQMEAEGMGYLAPIASNLTEAGRQANRRVEVIVTSTE